MPLTAGASIQVKEVVIFDGATGLIESTSQISWAFGDFFGVQMLGSAGLIKFKLK